MFSVRSHLSGVSVRMDLGEYKEGTVKVELYPVDNQGWSATDSDNRSFKV